MFESLRSVVRQQPSVDIHVTIPDNHLRETIVSACDGDDRWLYAATPNGSSTIWLLGGDEDEPTYETTKQQRVIDALCHETMHIVISHVESEGASVQYDDLLYSGIEPTTYMHRYARGDDE